MKLSTKTEIAKKNELWVSLQAVFAQKAWVSYAVRGWCGGTAVISDGLGVISRLWVCPVCESSSVAFWPRCFAPPVTGLMPETQAVNVLNNAVRSECGPLPRLPSFFHPPLSVLSLSSIVITAFHHRARRAFFMLFLAFQFSHFLFDSRTDDERGKHTNTWWVWHR